MAITGTTTISQLSALNSASLDTTLVGVDNGVTYKIELDVVADAVSDRINTLDEQRLDNLEQFTSSVSGTDIIISGSVVFSGSGQTDIKRGILYANGGYSTTNSFDIGAIQYPQYNFGENKYQILRANNTNINFSGAYYNFEEFLTPNGSLVLQNAYSTSLDNSGDPSGRFTGSVIGFEIGGHSPYMAIGGGHTSITNVYGSASFNGVAQLSIGTTFIQNFFGAGGISGSGFFQMSRTGNRSIGGPSQASYHVFGMISSGSASNQKRILAKNGSHYTIGWFNDNLNGGTPGVERFEIIAYDEIAGTTIHPSGQVSASVFYHHKSTNKIGLGTNQLLNTQNTISGSTTLIGSVISTNGFTGSIAATNGLVSSSAQITALGFATTGSNQFNGNQTITGSLIQGLGNIATGENSHAEGDSTQAIGNFSHAEGLGTIAYGDRSHAEGQDTIASGSYSHAEGNQTIALANHQHVQGQYNAVSSVPSAFIVGNGTDDGNRSNLIHAAGNEVEITGSLNVSNGITGSTNFDTIVNKPTLISGSSQLTSSFDTRYALSASFVSSSNLSSIQTITSASYAALTPVSGTLYIIIG